MALASTSAILRPSDSVSPTSSEFTTICGAPTLIAMEPEDFAKYKGKLRGKIVLDGGVQEMKLGFEPLAVRRNEANLLALANADVIESMDINPLIVCSDGVYAADAMLLTKPAPAREAADDH